MKKLVFIISKLQIGGAERILHDVAICLNKESDYEISVICLYDEGRLGKDLSEKEVKVYRNIMRNKFDISGIIKLINILRDKRPDLIFITEQTLTESAIIISSFFIKIPVRLIGVHSHALNRRPLYELLIDRISFNAARKIICVSESQKRHVIFYKKIIPQKIDVIYNGIDTERYRLNSKEKHAIPGIPRHGFIIGVVTCLRKEKAVDVLIKAVDKIIRHRSDIYLVIVGDGEERKNLEYLSRRLGLQSHVIFLGERQDVHNIIPLFDIACLSSRNDNFPVAILEYMACGKAVIATKVGAIPELIEDGVNGFLVERECPDELADKILYLVKNKDISISIGLNARKTVEHRFTLNHMINNYKELFNKVLR